MPVWITQREFPSKTTRTEKRVQYLDSDAELAKVADAAREQYFRNEPDGEFITLRIFEEIGKSKLEEIAQRTGKKISTVIQDIGLWVPIRISSALGGDALETYRQDRITFNCSKRPVPAAWKSKVPFVSSCTPHRLRTGTTPTAVKGFSMMNIVNIHENLGRPFQTLSIRIGDIRRLAEVAAWLTQYVIPEPDWKFEVNPGSLTFQYSRDSQAVVKVFVDIGNRLAAQENCTHYPPDPVVVGIELSSQFAGIRHAVRELLKRAYRDWYWDPRENISKRSIQPQRDHYYDILFLPSGSCHDVDEKLVEQYTRIINAERKSE